MAHLCIRRHSIRDQPRIRVRIHDSNRRHLRDGTFSNESSVFGGVEDDDKVGKVGTSAERLSAKAVAAEQSEAERGGAKWN